MYIYNQNRVCRLLFLITFFCLGRGLSGYAQLEKDLYTRNPLIEPDNKGILFLEIDNLSFFRNNEYVGYFLKGYSLPGFWIQPKLIYQPLDNVKLEAGLHALCFWGADSYPNSAYRDIATWKSKRYQVGFHFLPYFRAQIALSEQVNIVLGNLYGGSNHQLIEPLYNPELNLTADPETGLQLLYQTSFLHLDAWLNWESFIFYNDYHQEVFTVGLSTDIRLNNPQAPLHFYIPVQGLTQHRGGEIDTIFTNSVQTLMNGSIGAGAKWNKNGKILKSIEMEFDWVGYYQQAGSMWPFDSGSGVYIRASAQLGDFRIKGAYWKCKDFISLFGNPFYGALSTSHNDFTCHSPQMIYMGAEYSRRLGNGYSIGIDFDLYHHLPMDVCETGEWWRNQSVTSYSFGVYFRMTPSFLLKNFNRL